MKYPAQGNLVWTWPNVLLSTLILMAQPGIAQPGIAQPSAPVPPASPSASTVASPQDVERLLQEVKNERELQKKVRVEAEQAFSQTTSLFNLFLVVLGLILIAAIASLWLLRRAVINEVAEVAQRHLRELRDLKGNLADAIESVDLVMQKPIAWIAV